MNQRIHGHVNAKFSEITSGSLTNTRQNRASHLIPNVESPTWNLNVGLQWSAQPSARNPMCVRVGPRAMPCGLGPSAVRSVGLEVVEPRTHIESHLDEVQHEEPLPQVRRFATRHRISCHPLPNSRKLPSRPRGPEGGERCLMRRRAKHMTLHDHQMRITGNRRSPAIEVSSERVNQRGRINPPPANISPRGDLRLAANLVSPLTRKN